MSTHGDPPLEMCRTPCVAKDEYLLWREPDHKTSPPSMLVESRTLAVSRARQPQRGTSEGCWVSAPLRGSAGGAAHPATPPPWLFSLTHVPSPLATPCTSLSDHLVRLEEERRGNREAERFGGLEVDDQLELRGLLHGQV